MAQTGAPRVAMVTGGTRGIGFGITRRLAAEGFAVAVLATRAEPPEGFIELSRSAPILHVRGGVDDNDVHARFLDRTLQEFGRVDVLVNNAGVAPLERRDVLDMSPESWDRVLTTNLRGPFFLTQLVARHLVAQRERELGRPVPGRVDGVIVNVSSISATTVSTNRAEYCVSKAGVAMATQVWAARLAPEGILVHEVRPGVIATDMTAGVRERYDAAFADGLAPMARWGTPDDVASVVVTLAAGTMPYTTGEVIHVDGGMHVPRL